MRLKLPRDNDRLNCLIDKHLAEMVKLGVALPEYVNIGVLIKEATIKSVEPCHRSPFINFDHYIVILEGFGMPLIMPYQRGEKVFVGEMDIAAISVSDYVEPLGEASFDIYLTNNPMRPGEVLRGVKCVPIVGEDVGFLNASNYRFKKSLDYVIIEPHKQEVAEDLEKDLGIHPFCSIAAKVLTNIGGEYKDHELIPPGLVNYYYNCGCRVVEDQLDHEDRLHVCQGHQGVLGGYIFRPEDIESLKGLLDKTN